jgi:hypothetical protein
MNMIFRSGPVDRVPRQPLDTNPGTGRASFREFVRAFAQTIDAEAGIEGRDDLLRSIGAEMARLLPVPCVSSLEALQIEINDRLAQICWGSVRMELHEDDRALLIAHSGLPRIGSAGDPPGTWLAAALEGLYQTWITSQPGGDATLRVRRELEPAGDILIMRCVRG